VREAGRRGERMLTSLDHLIIAVRDLAAATATYTALLGRDPSWRGEHPGAGTANTLFRLERSYAELLSPVGAGALGDAVRAHLDAHGEGPFGLAFGTADAAACAGALRAAGLNAAAPSDGSGHDRASGRERHWRTVFLPTSDTRGVLLFAIEHRSPADALPLVAPHQPDAAVSAVDHAVVMTPDAEAAIRLYRDQLGIRLAFDKTFDARGVRLMFFRVGGVTVELAAPIGAPAADGGDRFWGISWQVPNVDAARVRLLAAGFDVSEVRAGNKSGTRVCTVRKETHGVATLLISHPPR
jgi:catechol 2,3-dioxygenase-like lactoylglutathione lyase family enzyme